MRRVVVTGIGVLTSIGKDRESYKAALKEGKSGARRITRFDPELFRTQIASELKEVDLAERLDKKEMTRNDLFSQYALFTADEAMKDSGLDLEKLNMDNTGVIWGSGIGGLYTLEVEIEYNADPEKDPKYSPLMIPKMIADIAPGLISIKYGFRGPNYGTVSACASSCHAIINAYDYIKMGRADIIVSGGSEATITRTGIGGFASMKAMSTRNDDPLTASRPFDRDRDGFVLGEGGACLILEEYEHAKKRGAKIYAEVMGGAMTADAYHITAPHPEGKGAELVMRRALEYSGVNKSDVDYINVHGTSTPLGDVAELNAISKVFGEDMYDLNISSTKSMTGHLLGASGAIESVASIMAITDSFVPPTINQFNLDPEIDPKLNLTPNHAQEKNVNIALCNTFGFGGHNTSVVFKKV